MSPQLAIIKPDNAVDMLILHGTWLLLYNDVVETAIFGIFTSNYVDELRKTKHTLNVFICIIFVHKFATQLAKECKWN